MATDETISYPFDPTGTSTLNRITNEQHVITSVNFQDYHYIVPRWAPFFTANVVLGFNNPDGSARTLVEGVDYLIGYEFIDASKACAKPVAGAIQFMDNDLAGVLTITYNTVGGNWTLSTQEIAELLANDQYNPRTTSWEQVVERPVDFPVIDHEWDLVDMVGASELVAAIDDVRDAILQNNGGGLAAHIADKSNPHQVTALQVGLGNVQNYPIATIAQAQAGTNATTYMTPATTAAAITALGSSNLNAHLNNFNNPHQVTKAQVGLGNVPNYAMATAADATAGTSQTLFMSPALVAQVVAVVNAALNSHVSNQLNPHNVTKDQISLFNVQNYPVATAQQAIAGTDNASYMTPLRVAQAIAQQSQTGLTAHLSDYTNPHQVTKIQVGLGNVDNFATATLNQSQDKTNNTTFITPQTAWNAIEFWVGNDFLNHINASNPHGTTKTDIGLGNVQNYPIAAQTDAQAGTSNVMYMTPLRTADAITALIGNAFAAHVAASNPHGTTKADVGLGLVANYAIASTPEAAAGLSTTTYLTPAGGTALVNGVLGGHLTDYTNPHQTTAAQVGLGNVQNYGVATTQDAITGSATNLYMTPATAFAGAQSVLSTHSTRTDNPHSVTAAQVGLGNVQNYPIASQLQAQQGTDSQTYMTPQRVADAIAMQAAALVNTHASRTDNPHQVTAAQVNAYTTSQVDQLLLSKLGVADTAANSNQLGGYTVSALQSLFTQSSVNGGYLPSAVADPNNTTNYSWAKLGTVTFQPNASSGVPNAKPDLIWLISGGEDPTALRSPSYRLTLSIRDTAANGYVNYTLTPESPEPPSGAPDFMYSYDAPSQTATIFARMSKSSNPMTIVELNHGAGGISMSALTWDNAPTATLMTKSASNAALQAQVDALQAQVDAQQATITQMNNDVVTGLQNLTTAINNI